MYPQEIARDTSSQVYSFVPGLQVGGDWLPCAVQVPSGIFIGSGSAQAPYRSHGAGLNVSYAGWDLSMASQGHTAARGYRLLRCSTCYLPSDVCICACTPTIHTSAQFWLLMHPDECLKPTNTARLIGASIPHTRFFPWYRTAPPAEFIALLTDRQFHALSASSARRCNAL